MQVASKDRWGGNRHLGSHRKYFTTNPMPQSKPAVGRVKGLPPVLAAGRIASGRCPLRATRRTRVYQRALNTGAAGIIVALHCPIHWTKGWKSCQLDSACSKWSATPASDS